MSHRTVRHSLSKTASSLSHLLLDFIFAFIKRLMRRLEMLLVLFNGSLPLGDRVVPHNPDLLSHLTNEPEVMTDQDLQPK